MSQPLLAVVMPVRNAAPYLDASIRSILEQTFTDFEFLALDDASTDGSGDLLDAWARRDPRLRVERSPHRLGPVQSSNRAVRATTAPLVARMDADDVSHPERLSREVAMLTRDPHTVLVGTLFEGIDESGRLVRPRDRWRLLRPSPFAPFPHGSAAFRRETFEAVGGYAAGSDYWEDLHLFRRMSRRGRVLVLPEALYRYRFHSSSARLSGEASEVEAAVARMVSTVYAEEAGRMPDRGSSAAGAANPLIAYSLAASRIWAGHPPRLLNALRLRSILRPDPTTLGIFAVGMMGALSPRATRAFLARVVAVRDRLAARRIGTEPFEWHFA